MMALVTFTLVTGVQVADSESSSRRARFTNDAKLVAVVAAAAIGGETCPPNGCRPLFVVPNKASTISQFKTPFIYEKKIYFNFFSIDHTTTHCLHTYIFIFFFKYINTYIYSIYVYEMPPCEYASVCSSIFISIFLFTIKRTHLYDNNNT